MSDDIEKPDVYPEWAVNDVNDPQTGELNVLEPPDSKKNVGWNAFEPPARQFFNWLGRITLRWIMFLDDRISRRHVTGNGSIILDKENVLITLYAINSSQPDEYIHAVGYRDSGAPIFNVLDSNVLTLGSTNSSGLQEINGAPSDDVIVYGIMQK